MTITNKFILLTGLLSASLCSYAQDLFKGYEDLFTTPKGYVAAYTYVAPVIDGDINDEAWLKAEWTSLFVDIEGDKKPKPYHETRAKLMWDDNYLYVAAEIKEPHVWAKLTERDEIVFFDNDFEIFLNPSNTTHQYFEIEINALNNIFDLYMNKPYREDAGALFSWDSQGMKHAVKVQGTLNDPSDIDEGWTVEFAIPFRAYTVGNNVHVPKDGEIWRLNFSRVQWDTSVIDGEYIKDTDENGRVKPEHNWVWSPQGLIDMHRPERWGYLQFSKDEVGSSKLTFERPYEEKMRDYLWLSYYKQKEYKEANKKYANSLSELGLPNTVDIDGIENTLELEATSSLFQVKISNAKNNSIQINNEGLIIK